MSSVFCPSQTIAIVCDSAAEPALRDSRRLSRAIGGRFWYEIVDQRPVEERHCAISAMKVPAFYVIYPIAYPTVFGQRIDVGHTACGLRGQPHLVAPQAVFRMAAK